MKTSNFDMALKAAFDYGEASVNYGLANPLNVKQMDILFAVKRDAWAKLHAILESVVFDGE